MVSLKAPFFLLAAFLVSVLPAPSQVIPAGQESRSPLSVGLGASQFYPDFGVDANGNRRPIYGATLWIDWHFANVPHYLNGFGVDIAARDLSKWGPVELTKGYGSFDCSDGSVPPNCTPNPSGLRFDTIEAGPMYTWRRYARLHPFAKILVGYGNMDFPAAAARYPSGRIYDKDTRTFFAPGGGLEYRLTALVDIRADYEYQFWPNFLGYNFVSPHGVSLGATYSFKPYHRHVHPQQP
jgi:opacity protein-like surface antigen